MIEGISRSGVTSLTQHVIIPLDLQIFTEQHGGRNVGTKMQRSRSLSSKELRISWDGKCIFQ